MKLTTMFLSFRLSAGCSILSVLHVCVLPQVSIAMQKNAYRKKTTRPTCNNFRNHPKLVLCSCIDYTRGSPRRNNRLSGFIDCCIERISRLSQHYAGDYLLLCPHCNPVELLHCFQHFRARPELLLSLRLLGLNSSVSYFCYGLTLAKTCDLRRSLFGTDCRLSDIERVSSAGCTEFLPDIFRQFRVLCAQLVKAIDRHLVHLFRQFRMLCAQLLMAIFRRFGIRSISSFLCPAKVFPLLRILILRVRFTTFFLCARPFIVFPAVSPAGRIVAAILEIGHNGVLFFLSVLLLVGDDVVEEVGHREMTTIFLEDFRIGLQKDVIVEVVYAITEDGPP